MNLGKVKGFYISKSEYSYIDNYYILPEKIPYFKKLVILFFIISLLFFLNFSD